jgi:hypothetical protein
MHPKYKSFPKSFPPQSPAKLYFCLDTSLNWTLAYAHWCNGGMSWKALKSIHFRGLRARVFSHQAPRPYAGFLPRLSVLFLHKIGAQ